MPEPLYVPILKGKEGEYSALEALDAETKSRLMPLIEIPAIPENFILGSKSKSIDEYLSGVPERIRKSFGSSPFYLDIVSLGRDGITSDGRTALEFVMSQASWSEINPLPVIYLDSSEAVLKASKSFTTPPGSGCCIRLRVKDFDEDVNLEAEMRRVVSTWGTANREIDVIVDLKDLGSDTGRATLIARSVLSMVPEDTSWRRVILAAASFPEDLSEVGAEAVVTIPRTEWHLWKTLQKRASLLRRSDLIYADYPIAHPVSKVVDPRTMRMSANIRYTADNHWLVIKGRNVRQYGFNQYFELCRLLMEREEYCGRGFSWGDGYISDCAEATQGPGNATTWRKVGVNHHLTLVTRALANAPRDI